MPSHEAVCSHETSSAGSSDSPSSGHHRAQCMTTFVQNAFWWATLSSDVKRFVDICAVSAQSRTPFQLPASFLEPLPITHPLWSNLELDFPTPRATLPYWSTSSGSLKHTIWYPWKAYPQPWKQSKLITFSELTTSLKTSHPIAKSRGLGKFPCSPAEGDQVHLLSPR